MSQGLEKEQGMLYLSGKYCDRIEGEFMKWKIEVRAVARAADMIRGGRKVRGLRESSHCDLVTVEEAK